MACIAAATFDVIIADLTIPGLSGVDLVKAMRSAGVTVKLIAHAGTEGDVAPNTILLAAQAFGADRILYLPFSRDEILAAVDELSA